MSAVNKEEENSTQKRVESSPRQHVQKGYYSEADIGKNFNADRKPDKSHNRKGEGKPHKKEHANRNKEERSQSRSKFDRNSRRKSRNGAEGVTENTESRAVALEKETKAVKKLEPEKETKAEHILEAEQEMPGVDLEPVEIEASTQGEEIPCKPAKESANEKIEVIGVRFRQAGKIYYFDPTGFEIQPHSHVIVETARGVEYGFVILGRREVLASKVIQPLKPVIRIATEEDEERNRQNREKEKEALKICKEKIAKHGLEMKLIDCEYTFDNNKVLFYFTADGRIDFRELVKDLASIFKTRIELRQIGVRDETKIRGGIGMCGRPLCCHTYLSEFAPVSIKMAKDQNLSLNPVKISGICGRLMCCLKNEEETYEWLNSKLPNEGDFVTTSDGLKGEVKNVNVLRQLVKVIVTLENDEKEVREYPVKELKFKTRRKRGDEKIQDAELRALEKLENLEKGSNSKL